MEVRKGYKQTDVGIIPEDWDVKRLGEIGEAIIGLTYKPTDVRPSGTLVLRSSNVQDGSLRFDDNVFVDTDISEKLMVRNGDILICVRNGSRDLIGKSAYIDDRAKGMTFGAFMTVFRSAHHAFAYHQFQFRIIKRQIHEHLGATINQITNKSLNSFAIPLPPTLAEQEAIAEALSDADALIEALEQLVAKKRQVKQGAMSELLTGKRRLSGFSGEWEVKEIGTLGLDISDGNYSGMYPKQSDFKAIGVPFIRANNIKGMKVVDDDMRFISTDKHNELLKGHLKKDDILITTRGELGNIALVPDRHIGSNINAQIVRINTRKIVNHIYLAFYLSYEDVQNKIKGAETGSALKQLPVGKLVKIPVVLPPLPEQTAIAEILSDMDAEISALEEKLVKAQQVKAGMMSELLTGKIRLNRD